MSKTRNLSDLLDANGDVKSTALDNVPSPTLTGIDDNATSTAVTIESSGNVLVGTTDNNPSNNTSGGNNGISFVNGQIRGAKSGNAPMDINRMDSDGDIAYFRKDGTTVGSIGNNGNILKINGNSSGIYVGGNSASIWAQSDNTHNLGTSGTRFQHLYLGGSVYLGGTGSANALDDYEEGTFTPLVEGTTTSGSATYTTRVAKYTKVGNIVHFNIFIRWQSGTGSGPFIITGLPFTSVGSSYHSAVTIGWMNDYDYTNGKIPRAYVPSSISRINFEESTDNGGSTNLNYDSQAGLILSGSYETS